MKYVIFDHCIKKGVTDIFHFLLFHGDLFPAKVHHRFGEPSDSPLLVAKGGRDWPEIFMPSRSVVVSESVKEVLASADNLEYCDVLFTKLINIKALKKDFSHCGEGLSKNHQCHPPGSIIETMPNSRILHASIPSKYYEMVIPVISRLLANQEGIQKHSVTLPNLSVDRKEIEFSSRISDEYPVYWSNAVVIQRDCYDKISSYFDSDFFTMTEYEF